MKAHPFVIVDVFAEKRYSGNELAVVRGGGTISEADKQKIAREFNFSETTFILSGRPRDGGFDVRIFTPRQEVPFAGHPTLGTAFVIQQDILKRPVGEVVLNLKVGPVRVRLTYRGSKPDLLWMEPPEPRFGRTLPAKVVASVLGLGRGDLDSRFPVLEVSTGLPFLIVPVRTLEAVQRCRVEEGRLAALVAKLDAKGILVFSPETCRAGNDLHARVFAGGYGVPEDPATGSANACLAGYLVKTGYWSSSRIRARVEQGYEIGRPSLLHLEAEEKGGRISVRVGGRVVPVARGTLVGP